MTRGRSDRRPQGPSAAAGWAVREEREGDHAAVHALNRGAFETPAEARLVDRLRVEAEPIVSLVAEHAGALVGHILFTPVRLDTVPLLGLMGLAPMAVAAGHRRRGIGSALVRAGLQRCVQLGAVAVVVLGHPAYYPRFGFVPADRFGLRCRYAVPPEAFMAIELLPGALDGVSGSVDYHPAFGEL